MTRLKSPELIVRDGKPVAVIIAIDDYQEILERLEDAEDLSELARMRAEPLSFRSLDSNGTLV